MSEYIERGALLEHIKDELGCCKNPCPENNLVAYGYELGLKYALSSIETAEAADVVEVKHGRWIIPTKIGCRAFDIPHCSVCDGVPCGVDSNTNYCPNCGAKMGV